MNRVKLWMFTVVIVAAVFLALRSVTISRRSEAVAALDARLASAAAHVAASTREISREASAAAAFVAREERLVAVLHANDASSPAVARGKAAKAAKALQPPVDPQAEEAAVQTASHAALAVAEKAFAFDLPRSTVVTGGNREWASRKPEPNVPETEATAFLRGAIDGQQRRGFVRLNGGLWFAAATPAGDGAGIVLLMPLDEAWAKALSTRAGVDVTLLAPDVKPISTVRSADIRMLQAVTKLAGAGDVGAARKVDVSVGPLRLPKLPQPMGGAAAVRARAIPLEGVKSGFVIVSAPAAAALDALAMFYWRSVIALALVLFVGLVLGFFFRSAEPAERLPKALVSAAARIESGDFAARAPQLAGKLGTIAAALNHAAELAGPAQAAQGASTSSDEFFQAPARPAPVTAPPPIAPPIPELSLPTLPATLASVPPPISAPSGDGSEEAHWQQIFQDFVRTRSSCGEPSEGLTFEKFRQKLEGNKAQLVAKYACKTVRFQVYVKDGKTALKATPVK